MSEGRWSIYRGDPLTCYRDMFITLDLSSNPEVLWWKNMMLPTILDIL